MSKAEKLSLDAVKKVSQLARLKMTDAELRSIQTQLSAVLENFEQIANVPTNGIRPLFTPTDLTQAMRKDEVEVFEAEKILANAPDRSGNLFKVPPVV